MRHAINFDSENWSCCDALVDIYFSDWREALEDDAFRADLIRCIVFHIKHESSDSQYFDKKDERYIKTVIARLKKRATELVTLPEACPLVWLRFAVTSLRHSTSPSQYFLKTYEQWRFERLRINGFEKIRKTQAESKMQSDILINGKHHTGYSIDQFLILNIEDANLGTKSRWLLFNESTASIKNGRKQSTTRCVGANAFAVIRNCIETAAENKQIPGLHQQRIGDRYQSDISRTELASKLKKEFGKRLHFSEETIVRAVSSFVACPGYRIGRE